MKVKLKELPSKKVIKKFIETNYSLKNRVKIKRVSICSDVIMFECKVITDLSIITPFYIDIFSFNVKNKTCCLVIKANFYKHLINNIDANIR